MANSLGAKKRIRINERRRLRNRLRLTATRTAIKRLRSEENKDKAAEMLPSVFSKIDRCAKTNIFHKNKAANLKSSLAKHVSAL